MRYIDKIRSFLNIQEQNTSWKVLILLMIISYAFSIAIRYIWVLNVQDVPSYQYNDQIMINTNDGYFFAQGAKDILNDTKLYNASPIQTMTSKLTAFFVKILPFSFESIILYLPAFLGSLLVIPVMLIARSLNLTYVGFGASLIAGIAWSYYNRTMVGYYDTDMLTIVLPTLVLSLVIFSMHNKKLWILFILSAVMMFYVDWYRTSFFFLPLLFATIFYIGVYERKNIYNYQLLSILMVSMSGLGYEKISILVVAIMAIFYFLQNNLKQDIRNKIIWIIAGVSFIYILFNGAFVGLYSILEAYVIRKAISGDLSLVFFNVASTVREAGLIPFETFANRISGGVFLLFASTLGVVLLVIRYPIMLIALPMMGVGFMALGGGLRFTVYAVPVNALGMSFIIFLFATYIKSMLPQITPIRAKATIYIATIVSLLSVNLYYHIEHVKGYMVPTVFSKKEVALLDVLNKTTNTKDYIISWWDYGYPIRYYAQAQTLIDGGRHDGVDNFPVSFALLRPMIPSANMLRLAVEYNEQNLLEPRAGSNISNMITDYRATSSKNFLLSLKSKSFKTPSPTREIYLYLPYRMFNIFPTIMLFSNLDMDSGRQFSQPLFFKSLIQDINPNEVTLSQGVKIFVKNKKITGKIELRGNIYNIKNYYTTYYDKQGVLHKTHVLLDKKSGINVIYMMDYRAFLILDDKSLKSTFVQLFALENYDKGLFEPVALDPQVKVYRLKI